MFDNPKIRAEFSFVFNDSKKQGVDIKKLFIYIFKAEGK